MKHNRFDFITLGYYNMRTHQFQLNTKSYITIGQAYRLMNDADDWFKCVFADHTAYDILMSFCYGFDIDSHDYDNPGDLQAKIESMIDYPDLLPQLHW